MLSAKAAQVQYLTKSLSDLPHPAPRPRNGGAVAPFHQGDRQSSLGRTWTSNTSPMLRLFIGRQFGGQVAFGIELLAIMHIIFPNTLLSLPRADLGPAINEEFFLSGTQASGVHEGSGGQLTYCDPYSHHSLPLALTMIIDISRFCHSPLLI